MSMFPTLFDKDPFKEIFQSPFLRRFPSLPLEEMFTNKNGLTISEGPKDISILADMPGLKASDIEVHLENGILQLKGEKKQETEDKERRVYCRSNSSYRYTIDLPVGVDESQVDAFYDKGVMHVTIQKAQPAQSKKIAVREKNEK